MFSFIKKFQSGGLIDTAAMKSDIKGNNSFFKDGDYTAAGRKRLAAVQSVEDNQAKGLLYNIDDESKSFTIIDKSGKEYHDIEGRGMAMNEGNSPLYGLVGRSNKSKKEISQVIGGASKYYLQPKKKKEEVVDTDDTDTDVDGLSDTARVQEGNAVDGKVKASIPTEADKTESKTDTKSGSTFKPNFPTIGKNPNSTPSTDELWEGEKSKTEKPGAGKTDASFTGFPDSWKDYADKIDKTLYEILRAPKSPLKFGGDEEDNKYLEELNSEQNRRLKDGKLDPNASRRVTKLSTQEINAEIVRITETRAKSFTAQVDPSTTQALNYIEEEMKRLVATPSSDMMEKKQVLDALTAKKQNLILKYDKLMLDPNMATFKAFYDDDLPANTYQNYSWEPEVRKLNTTGQTAIEYLKDYRSRFGEELPRGMRDGNQAGWWSEGSNLKKAKTVTDLINQVERGNNVNDLFLPKDGNKYDRVSSFNFGDPNLIPKVEAVKSQKPIVKTSTPLTSQERDLYKNIIVNNQGGKYNSYTLYDGSKITQQQLINLIDSAQSKEDLKEIYLPKSTSYGAYNELIPLSSLKNIKSKGNNQYDYQFNIEDIISTRGFKLPQRYYKNGGVLNLIKRDAMKLVPKNAVPKAQLGTFDWNNLMTTIKSAGIKEPFYPTLSGKSPEQELLEKQQKEAAAKKAGLGLQGGLGSTGSYADTKGEDPAITAKNAQIAAADEAAINRKTELTHNVDESMQANDDLYPQNDTRVRGTNGPILSTTGINTPLGQVQYGDIAQFLLMRNARNRKVDEVPVNLKKFTASGARNVLAARDLESATMNDAQNKISKIRSQYRGSDPVMAAIMANQSNSQQREAQATLDLTRGQYRRGEEDRVAGQMEERRQQLASDHLRSNDVDNENQEKLYQADLAKAEMKAKRETEFMNNVGSLLNNMQTRANAQSLVDKDYATNLSAVEHQNNVSKLQSEHQSLLDDRSNARLMGLTKEQYTELQRKITAKAAEITEATTVRSKQVKDEANQINRGSSVWRWGKPKNSTYE
jgi:hypothetical protein